MEQLDVLYQQLSDEAMESRQNFFAVVATVFTIASVAATCAQVISVVDMGTAPGASNFAYQLDGWLRGLIIGVATLLSAIAVFIGLLVGPCANSRRRVL